MRFLKQPLTSGKTVFIDRIFLRHRAPKFLLRDRGTPFLRRLMQEVLLHATTIQSVTTAYHPQTYSPKSWTIRWRIWPQCMCRKIAPTGCTSSLRNLCLQYCPSRYHRVPSLLLTLCIRASNRFGYCLAILGEPLVKWFCSWHGLSGRRGQWTCTLSHIKEPAKSTAHYNDAHTMALNSKLGTKYSFIHRFASPVGEKSVWKDKLDRSTLFNKLRSWACCCIFRPSLAV